MPKDKEERDDEESSEEESDDDSFDDDDEEDEEEEGDEEDEEDEEGGDTKDADSDDGEFDRKEAALQKKLHTLEKKKAKAKQELDALSQNQRIELEHSRRAIKLSGYFFIAPLFPCFLSLLTIFFGTIIMNTAGVAKCSARLDVFLTGQIVLSYILVMLYGSFYIGCGSCRWQSMTAALIAEGLYVLLGVGWNIYGTAIVSDATSCAFTAPALYKFCRAEMYGFWICVITYAIVGLRQLFLRRTAETRADRAAQADKIRKLKMQDEELSRKAKLESQRKLAADKKKQAEEDKIRLAKEAEEAKKRELAAKYGDSSDEDTATPLPGASTPARAGAAATASAALDDDEMF